MSSDLNNTLSTIVDNQTKTVKVFSNLISNIQEDVSQLKAKEATYEFELDGSKTPQNGMIISYNKSTNKISIIHNLNTLSINCKIFDSSGVEADLPVQCLNYNTITIQFTSDWYPTQTNIWKVLITKK